jgi:hypothetical protein
MEVRFAGIKLEQRKQDLINKLIDHLVSRGFEMDSLDIDVKESRKAGGRSLYTTQLRVDTKSGMISSEATEWVLEKSFRKIVKEIKG